MIGYTQHTRIPEDKQVALYGDDGKVRGYMYDTIAQLYLKPFYKYSVMSMSYKIWEQLDNSIVQRVEFLEPKIRDSYSRGASGSLEWVFLMEDMRKYGYRFKVTGYPDRFAVPLQYSLKEVLDEPIIR
jgi:hypothetical protein